jgi:hypothetical protein
MMKHSTVAFLFVAVLAQQAQAAAAVYKCVKYREVTYQSEPCPTPTRRTEPNIKKLNEERMKKLLETGTTSKSGKSANDGQYSAKAGDASVAPTPSANTPVTPVPAPVMQAATYKCDGRKYCSQMTSCEEAKYFLNNCPGVNMDNYGEGNGIPCERQWCKRILR